MILINSQGQLLTRSQLTQDKQPMYLPRYMVLFMALITADPRQAAYICLSIGGSPWLHVAIFYLVVWFVPHTLYVLSRLVSFIQILIWGDFFSLYLISPAQISLKKKKRRSFGLSQASWSQSNRLLGWLNHSQWNGLPGCWRVMIAFV